jgi:hypothetical protein
MGHDMLRIAVMLALALMVCANSAWAHMHDRPDLNQWFSNLGRVGKNHMQKTLCCSLSDGAVVAADEVRQDEVDKCVPTQVEYGSGEMTTPETAHFCVLLQGKWWMVPDNVVLDTPNLYGQALIWPVPIGSYNNGVPEQKFFFRCFLPGAGI